MRTEQEMIQLNRTQAEYYDKIEQAADENASNTYAQNERANWMTRIWALLRTTHQKAVIATGIDADVRKMQLEWFTERRGGRFLEIGCHHGGDYTFDLIDTSSEYVGIELSPAACVALKRKVAEYGAAGKATIVCGDFLEFNPGYKFDLIYAHGVLHHFENPDPLFARIRQLIADGGLLIFVEPAAINPVYQFLRQLYRPFQSDAAWEWPFRKETVRQLQRRFEITGGVGWGRYSAPLSLMCGLPVIGQRLMLPFYKWVALREVTPYSETSYWLSSYVVAKCRPMRKLV
jgi:SAM-dependent methyltransferase